VPSLLTGRALHLKGRREEGGKKRCVLQ
jgi:hypothetical protein